MPRTLPFASKLLRVDVGAVWVVGEVADSKRLASLKPDMESLVAFSIDHEAAGVTVFAASGENGAAIHVRSFAPAHGIAAAYLQATNQLARFGSRYVARQGMQAGRDGRVHVRVDSDGIRIGGHAVTCIDGSVKA